MGRGDVDATPTGQLWVAERDGAVIGFAAFGAARRPEGDGAWELYGLNVDPSAHRGGAGSALLEVFHRTAASRSATGALLWVAKENARARAFYERRGYAQDGSESKDEVLGAIVNELRYRRPV